MDALTPAEKFMTDLLFNFLDRCSITFSIFWVVELIDNDTLLDLYYLFHHCVHPDWLDDDMQQYRSYQKQRLKYLRGMKRDL